MPNLLKIILNRPSSIQVVSGEESLLKRMLSVNEQRNVNSSLIGLLSKISTKLDAMPQSVHVGGG